jgi:mRNA interferase RelE/StbE
MGYSIEFSASALREFQAFDRQVQRRISVKIEQLAENPFSLGARKFHGETDHWRIRIGDYRVIYRIDRRRVVVVIVRVGHRREVYR